MDFFANKEVFNNEYPVTIAFDRGMAKLVATGLEKEKTFDVQLVLDGEDYFLYGCDLTLREGTMCCNGDEYTFFELKNNNENVVYAMILPTIYNQFGEAYVLRSDVVRIEVIDYTSFGYSFSFQKTISYGKVYFIKIADLKPGSSIPIFFKEPNSECLSKHYVFYRLNSNKRLMVKECNTFMFWNDETESKFVELSKIK